MFESNDRGRAILSLNRALLGEVNPNFRAVTIGKENNELQVRFVFYEQPSEDELETIGCIGTETLAGLSEIDRGAEFWEVNNEGKIEMKPEEILVYRRKD